MSNTIKPKRSYTTSAVPSGLSAGELAINAADGKVWIGSALGANVLVASLSLSDINGSTTNITEGTNLFYTDSRSRLALSAGTGISYDNTTGVITNSSPDQTVKLTAGTGISTSGTYPNFTITNSSPDQIVSLTAGTGIVASGTYPSFTISADAASANTVSKLVIRDSSGNFSANTITASLTGTATKANNLTGGNKTTLLGSIPYQSDTDTTSLLSPNVNWAPKFLSQSGDGTNGKAPVWSSLSLMDIGGVNQGGILYGGASYPYSTQPGTVGQLLASGGTSSPTWTNPSSLTVGLATSLVGGNGTTLLGSIPYQSGTDTTSLLSPNTSSTIKFLSQTGTGTNGAAPVWSTLTSSNITTALGFTPYNSTNPNGYTSNTGTVTSVGMSVPTGLSVSGSPVTSTGTLAVTFSAGYSIPTTASQTQWDSAYSNRISSLTTTGSSGSATLVSNTLNVPTYTLSGLGGQPLSTNLTSLSGLTYSSASFVKMTSSGTFSLDTATYLTGNQSITLSGDASGSGTTSIAVTLATVSATKGGTGQTSYTLGDILYCSATNVLSKLAGNTTSGKQFLSQTGTGTVSAAPAWASLNSSDITTALGFTPASPGGSSGQFQYNNGSGGFSGTSALQYQATATEDIRVYGTSTSRVPFSVNAPPSMSANIFEITSQQTIPYITVDNFGAFSVLQNDIIGCNNIIFKNSSNNRTITLARPSTFAASFTLTLPTSAGSSNQHLMTNGSGTLFWGSYIASLSGGNSTTLLGSIPYQSDVNTTTLLSPNTTTTKKFLRQTGTGTNGAAPVWDTLTSSDIGLENVENTAISTWAGSTNITTVGEVTTRNLAVVPVASTGNPSPSVTVTAPAHTGLTASTESNDLNINLSRTAQFATGALTTQRAIRIQPPTYSAVGASVITNASTVSIDNPPAAGSNVTITNPAALNVGTSNGVGIIISGVQNQSYDLFRANITNIDSTTFISTTRPALTISNGGQLVLNPTNSGVGNTNQLRFLELAANGTNYVGFKGPDSIAANVIWTLPSADGTSGQVLTTNGSGTLSWTTASSGSSIPSGSMQMYAGSVTQSASSGVVTTNAPSGWLLCNGDIVSRTTYSALFTAIGTTYGAGDGSTTFALPDMRGRVPIGVGQGAGLTNRTLASTTGVESITLSSSNIPSLTTGSESANHTHSGTTDGVSVNHYHQNFSDGVGSGNMGRAQYGFSGLGGGYAGVLIVGSGQNNYSTSYTGYISSDHKHTFSTGFASSGHTHTYTNSSPTSINNMQPSISINFIIKI